MKINKKDNNNLDKTIIGLELCPYYKDISSLENLFNYIPEGIILAYIPHDKNMSISDINNFLYDYDFVLCDGEEFYNEDSHIFNIPGRFLPKLNDEYFLMGSASAGNETGNNYLQAHRHSSSLSFISSNFYGSVDINNHTHSNITIDNTSTSTQHIHNHLSAIRVCDHDITTCVFANWDGTEHYYGRIYKTLYHKDHTHTWSLSMGGSNQKTKIDHMHTIEILGSVGENLNINLTDNRPKYIKTYFIIKFK